MVKGLLPKAEQKSGHGPGYEHGEGREEKDESAAVSGLAKISSVSTSATMSQDEPGTGTISAKTFTPRLSRPSNAPVFPRAAWTAGTST